MSTRTGNLLASAFLVAAMVSIFCGVACTSVHQKKGPPIVDHVAEAQGQIASAPFTWHDNRLLVDVFLNGKGPFVMIFDVGGANSLTPEVQRILELRSQGPEVNMDGGKSTATNLVHLKTVQVGDFKLTEQKFQVQNLNLIRKTFRFAHLDGVIGYELLQHAKVRINFDRQKIEWLSTQAPTLSEAQTLNFELVDQTPLIHGKINGQPANILIDTGDRSNLTLFHKFAQSSKIQELFTARDSLVTGMGLGGPIPGKIASVQSVELGSTEVKDVLARLPLTKRGYFFASEISASVGMGVLKGFNLEFDATNHSLALQRRKNYNEESTFVPVPTRLR